VRFIDKIKAPEKFTLALAAAFEDILKALPPSENLRLFESIPHTGKIRAGDYFSSLTVSFHRPCARRRESTLRPSFDFIRSRNPCLFFRLRLLG
jgi:hypothetical protein